MNRILPLSLGLVAALSLAVFALAAPASASPSANPQATYGAVTLAAGTATAIPSSPLNGRAAITVFNLDSASIFCGWDSSVTTSTGYPVPSNSSLSAGVSFSKLTNGAKLYCISSAGQTAPNNTRYMEGL